MSAELLGPNDRYRLRLEVRHDPSAQPLQANTGVPAGDAGGRRYIILLQPACAVILQLGESGLTLESVSLLEASEVAVTAYVTPGTGSPDWLPQESEYLLFQGDRQAARQIAERFIALEGMALERSWPAGDIVPLDRLALAVGHALTRANSRLTRACGEAGTAVVASITLRVALHQTDLNRDRVLLSLARPDVSVQGQYVELKVNAAPIAEEVAEEDPPSERLTPRQ